VIRRVLGDRRQQQDRCQRRDRRKNNQKCPLSGINDLGPARGILHSNQGCLTRKSPKAC
jgi:hypothetical protein